MSVQEVYYLSSLDSVLFEPVRRCVAISHTVLSSGQDALVVQVEPPVCGQPFDSREDLITLLLVARFAGSSVRMIEGFPCFVYIIRNVFEAGQAIDAAAATKNTIGWGELYRSADDALTHRFDSKGK